MIPSPQSNKLTILHLQAHSHSNIDLTCKGELARNLQTAFQAANCVTNAFDRLKSALGDFLFLTIIRYFHIIYILITILDLFLSCTYTVIMDELSFVWDPKKNILNQSKHDGIDFEEARTVFYDEFARVIFDPNHSSDEDRFIILGLSTKLRLLVVCHCYRESDSVIRLISARKATRKEAEAYERKRNA